MPRYAAIDIGSNSVRMQAAEVKPGKPPQILAAEREVTRLGTGVFREGRITEDAMQLVCGVLRRMAQIYQRLDVVSVRAVATSATRDASNQGDFLERASEAIGAPVEVISGSEEARLIHLGVQTRWPHPRRRVLIVDVGGGSGELIVSDNGVMHEGVSRPLGAVRLAEMFLRSDPPSRAELHHMEKFIEEKLAPVVKRIGKAPFDRVIATSATAAAMVCAVNHVPRASRDQADRMRASTAGIRALHKKLALLPVAARKKLAGIGPRRAEIIVPGVSVFLKVLETLQLPALHYSTAGVRDGIIADLARRGTGEDVGHLTGEQLQAVSALARRFGVNMRNGKTVAAFARVLFNALQPQHRLPAAYSKLLEAAAYLRDAGHFISDTGHHKHSAYLVQHADLPGFTDSERMVIAQLCRYHRKTMPTARHTPFQAMPPDSRRAVSFMAPLLRLADGLDASQEQRIATIDCTVRNGNFQVALHGSGDVDLELWQTGRAAEVFRQVYRIGLALDHRTRHGKGAVSL